MSQEIGNHPSSAAAPLPPDHIETGSPLSQRAPPQHGTCTISKLRPWDLHKIVNREVRKYGKQKSDERTEKKWAMLAKVVFVEIENIDNRQNRFAVHHRIVQAVGKSGLLKEKTASLLADGIVENLFSCMGEEIVQQSPEVEVVSEEQGLMHAASGPHSTRNSVGPLENSPRMGGEAAHQPLEVAGVSQQQSLMQPASVPHPTRRLLVGKASVAKPPMTLSPPIEDSNARELQRNMTVSQQERPVNSVPERPSPTIIRPPMLAPQQPNLSLPVESNSDFAGPTSRDPSLPPPPPPLQPPLPAPQQPHQSHPAQYKRQFAGVASRDPSLPPSQPPLQPSLPAPQQPHQSHPAQYKRQFAGAASRDPSLPCSLFTQFAGNVWSPGCPELFWFLSRRLPMIEVIPWTTQTKHARRTDVPIPIIRWSNAGIDSRMALGQGIHARAGESVYKLVDMLWRGELQACDLEPMEVIYIDGELVTINNRLLAALKMYQALRGDKLFYAPCVVRPPHGVPEYANGHTSPNGGMGILPDRGANGQHDAQHLGSSLFRKPTAQIFSDIERATSRQSPQNMVAEVPTNVKAHTDVNCTTHPVGITVAGGTQEWMAPNTDVPRHSIFLAASRATDQRDPPSRSRTPSPHGRMRAFTPSASRSPSPPIALLTPTTRSPSLPDELHRSDNAGAPASPNLRISSIGSMAEDTTTLTDGRAAKVTSTECVAEDGCRTARDGVEEGGRKVEERQDMLDRERNTLLRDGKLQELLVECDRSLEEDGKLEETLLENTPSVQGEGVFQPERFYASGSILEGCVESGTPHIDVTDSYEHQGQLKFQKDTDETGVCLNDGVSSISVHSKAGDSMSIGSRERSRCSASKEETCVVEKRGKAKQERAAKNAEKTRKRGKCKKERKPKKDKKRKHDRADKKGKKDIRKHG